MTLKYTRTSLQKIEKLLGAIDYKVRYEKGQFQSGYCIVEHRNIVVINKFFDVKARINTLLDILSKLTYNVEELSPEFVEILGSFDMILENRREEAEAKENQSVNELPFMEKDEEIVVLDEVS